MPRKKMQSLGIEDTDLHTTRSAEVREVLDHWARLEFAFAMDEDNSEPSHTGGETSRPQQEEASYPSSGPPIAGGSDLHDATLLAQFAAMPGLRTEFALPFFQPHPHTHVILVPGLYSSFFTSGSDLALNQLVHQQGQQPTHTLPVPAQVALPIPASDPLQAVPSPPSGETNADRTDVEQLSTAEEKRRRNTTASARFRMKKKLRTINLERSVSDLTRRAEELQKEVSDLRRENGWLKEIVTLKGNQHAVRMALSQVGQVAGTNSIEAGAGQSSRTLSKNPTSITTAQLEENSSQGESGDDNPGANRKGKGKKLAKGKRK